MAPFAGTPGSLFLAVLCMLLSGCLGPGGGSLSYHPENVTLRVFNDADQPIEVRYDYEAYGPGGFYLEARTAVATIAPGEAQDLQVQVIFYTVRVRVTYDGVSKEFSRDYNFWLDDEQLHIDPGQFRAVGLPAGTG
jgi:hypothetical protein